MKTTQPADSRRGNSIAAAFTEALVLNPLFRLGMFLTMIVALMTTGVYSQSLQEAQRPVPAPAADPSAGTGNLAATTGPTIYVTDAAGNIDQRAVLLKNLSGKGLAQIYGAAYDGYFLLY
jgi:hypothetical protein